MKPLLLRWLPLLLWAAIIFATSANSEPYQLLPASWKAPINPAEPSSPSWDEVLGWVSHTGEYAILAFLAARALAWKARARPVHLIFAWAGSALYGLSDEIHQMFVPGRTFQLGDLALDFFGALIGIFLFVLFRRKSGSTS